MKIKVMLVSKMTSTLTEMRELIADEDIAIVGDSPGGSTALDNIDNLNPDILIMSLGKSDMDVLSLAERVVQNRLNTFVILLAEHIDVPTLQQAMSVGVHNVIEFPKSQKEFADYIKTTYNSENARLGSLNGSHRSAWSSKVITVFGSKGGLGKTTLAVNLAVKLAEAHKKVALVDLDLQFGDVHIFLDLEPKDTIAELIQDVYIPNIDSVRTYMVVHSSGVHVLCAPKSPEYADVVSTEQVQSLLSLLRSYYDFVIIDTAPNFNDITLAAIEASTTLLFVTGLDISILKNSKLSMSILESLQQKEKIRVIINRAAEINTITVGDVQRIIDAPILAKIPSDYMTAVSALNRGVPFVQGAPNSKLSQSVGELANLLITGTENYDIQKLPPKERRQLANKYRVKEKKPLTLFNRK